MTHPATPEQFLDDLIEVGSSIALPELCGGPPADALYYLGDRGGLGTVALPQPSLDERQLDALARFRFAQYAAAGYVDRELVLRERLDRAPLASYTSPHTVHFIVFAVATGELMASMTMLGPPPTAPGTLVGSRERPLFEVEQQFGWGTYNRLARVPETPVERVRDFGRLVKNFRRAEPRAVIELLVAAPRVLVASADAIDVCIGQIHALSQRTLDLIRLPLTVLRSGLPCSPPDHPFNPGLGVRDLHPFAFAVADLAHSARHRDAIEATLALPDRQALSALAALKRRPWVRGSSLIPQGGVPALADTPLPQRTLSIADRHSARERGRELARFAPFAGLSDSELTTLRTLAGERDVAAGETLLTRGEIARELILIDGACLGAPGVVAGRPAPARVVARVPERSLRIPAHVYREYLRELPDVELELVRLAFTPETLSPDELVPASGGTRA